VDPVARIARQKGVQSDDQTESVLGEEARLHAKANHWIREVGDDEVDLKELQKRMNDFPNSTKAQPGLIALQKKAKALEKSAKKSQHDQLEFKIPLRSILLARNEDEEFKTLHNYTPPQYQMGICTPRTREEPWKKYTTHYYKMVDVCEACCERYTRLDSERRTRGNAKEATYLKSKVKQHKVVYRPRLPKGVSWKHAYQRGGASSAREARYSRDLFQEHEMQLEDGSWVVDRLSPRPPSPPFSSRPQSARPASAAIGRRTESRAGSAGAQMRNFADTPLAGYGQSNSALSNHSVPGLALSPGSAASPRPKRRYQLYSGPL